MTVWGAFVGSMVSSSTSGDQIEELLGEKVSFSERGESLAKTSLPSFTIFVMLTWVFGDC